LAGDNSGRLKKVSAVTKEPMKFGHKIKLLEMEHAYWLALANWYIKMEQSLLFVDAIERCNSIRLELEVEINKTTSVSSLDAKKLYCNT